MNSEALLWVLLTLINFGFGIANILQSKLFFIVNFVAGGLCAYNLLEALELIK